MITHMADGTNETQQESFVAHSFGLLNIGGQSLDDRSWVVVAGHDGSESSVSARKVSTFVMRELENICLQSWTYKGTTYTFEAVPIWDQKFGAIAKGQLAPGATFGNLWYYDLTVQRFQEFWGCGHVLKYLEGHFHRTTWEARWSHWLALRAWTDANLVGLAPDAAEQKIRDWTASSDTFGLVLEPAARYIFGDMPEPVHLEPNFVDALLWLTADTLLSCREYFLINVSHFRFFFEFNLSARFCATSWILLVCRTLPRSCGTRT